MKKYLCENHRPVMADAMNGAAETFALRKARAAYGKKGYCRTLNQNAYSQDGTFVEFSAFIGYKTGQHETSGHNVNFTVCVA